MDTRELKRRWELKEEECKTLARNLQETQEAYEAKIEDIIKRKNDEIDGKRNCLTMQTYG